MRNLEEEDRLLVIEILISQKELTLVRGETYLVMKLKQDQDPELIGQFLDEIIFLLLMILLQQERNLQDLLLGSKLLQLK